MDLERAAERLKPLSVAHYPAGDPAAPERDPISVLGPYREPFAGLLLA